jgi:hypothetical protein
VHRSTEFFKMRNQIELKNIKFSEWNSEETNCFQAVVYFKGKKVGIAYNEGHGGPTDIQTENMEAYKEFRDHCKAFSEANKDEYYETYTILDIIFEEWLEAHYSKKDKARMQKNFNKGICYTKNEGAGTFAVLTFNRGTAKVTISELLKSANGRALLRRSYEKLISDGAKVLNDNLKFA